MSYHEGIYIPPGHKTHAQIRDLSDQLYRRQEHFLVENFVSTLPNAVFIEKQSIKVDKVHNVWKGWNAEKQNVFSTR